MGRKASLGSVSRVVVKFGTTSLTQGGDSISKDFMDSVAEQVWRLRQEGIQVLIVTSGAVGVGLKAMGVVPKPKEIPIRQAAASVGQGLLMQKWSESFQRYGILVGQVLMTLDSFSDRESALNLTNTVESLIDNGVVPIFNENDAVAVAEIKFGDNDTLSAIVASRMDADLLVILSDIEGLYDSNPRTNPDARFIPEVRGITEEVRSMAGGTTGMGTGGMRTKIAAAEICRDAGCNMIIASSHAYGAVYRTVVGDDVGTLFISDSPISKKRRWIKAAHPSGRLVVDRGALDALAHHKSLLPVGIVEVAGTFDKGEVVEVVYDGDIVAKGISEYSSADLDRIKGRRSSEFEGILGYRGHDAVITDNLVLMWVPPTVTD